MRFIKSGTVARQWAKTVFSLAFAGMAFGLGATNVARGVYFNGERHVLSREYTVGVTLGDTINWRKIAADGKVTVEQPITHGAQTGDIGLIGEGLAVCQYSNRIFAFYDNYNGGFREIYYKYYDPNNPDFAKTNGWSGPKQKLPFKVKSYSRLSLAAYGGSNGKLYLFAASLDDMSIGAIYEYSPGNAEWDKAWWQIASFPVIRSFSALSVTELVLTEGDDKGKKVMLFGGPIGTASNIVMLFLYHAGDSAAYEAGTDMDMFYTGVDAFDLFAGSKKGGTQGTVAQLICPNSTLWWRLRGCEWTPGTGKYGSNGSFSAIEDLKDDDGNVIVSWENFAAIPWFTNEDSPGYRMNMSLYCSNDTVKNVKSDLFAYEASRTLNTNTGILTLDDGSDSPVSDGNNLWSIVGVIEGVPPFTRNNQADTEWSSSVSFGTSEEKMVSTASSYAGSFSAQLEVNIFGMSEDFSKGGEVSVSAGYEYFTQTTRQTTEVFTKQSQKTWLNVADNVTGDLGFVLLAKPVLKNDRFIRKSYDGSKALFKLNSTYAIGTYLDFIEYQLEKPDEPLAGEIKLEGMRKRYKSSDFKAWREKVTAPRQANVISSEMMTVNPHTSGSMTFAKATTLSTQQTSRHTFNAGVSASGWIGLFGGGVTIAHNSTWQFDSTHSTTLSSNLTAALQPLPVSGAAGEINKLSVVGYWLNPTNVAGDSWIPKNYHWSQPWCLTWYVSDYFPRSNNTAALTRDFNGDGKQDLALSKPSNVGNDVNAGSDTELEQSVFLMSGYTPLSGNSYSVKDAGVEPVGLGDFNLDNKTDILWQAVNTGELFAECYDGVSILETLPLPDLVINSWEEVMDVGDFNADGACDILIWNGMTSTLDIAEIAPLDLTVARRYSIWNQDDFAGYRIDVGDFNGDGIDDLVLANTSTHKLTIIILSTSGVVATNEFLLGTAFQGVGDFNGDGMSDLLVSDAMGNLQAALMDGVKPFRITTVKGVERLKKNAGVSDIGDFNGDGVSDIVIKTLYGAKRMTSPKIGNRLFKLYQLAPVTEKGQIAIKRVGKGFMTLDSLNNGYWNVME